MPSLHQLRIALNGRLPMSFKTAYLKVRELNAGSRALPDFLILGAMKAGTTSLFNYLCLHPQVVGSVPKEIFFFCSRPQRSVRWYQRHFPNRRKLEAAGCLCGEATPTSLYSASAAARAASCVPQARLIVTLREPAARAVSHYYHRQRAAAEKRPIDEVFSEAAIQQWRQGECPDLPGVPYFKWSDYPSGLEKWLAHYPSEQLLVLQAEAMYADTQGVFDRVCDFLELDRHLLKDTRAFNTAGQKTEKPIHFEALKAAFSAQNEALRNLGYFDFQS